MRHAVPIAQATRTTWRVTTREIAEALGIPLAPDQWVILEDASKDRQILTDVDVVVWERAGPAAYNTPEMTAKPAPSR